MKKTLIIFLLLSLNSLHSYSSQLKSTAAFTENKGQIADSDQKVRNDILFYTNTSNTTVYLKNFGFSYVIANRSKRPDISEVIVAGAERENYSDVFLRIDASFENANQNTIIETENVQTEYSNYYLAHCPQGIKNVMSCKNVLCKNLYNGIDVRYKTNESGFKYDILVKPGANPSQIKIKYDGIENLSIKNEQLLIKSGNEILTENIPRIYQNINGKIIDVKGAYEINGKTVSFRIGNYNKSYELVIDPWATLYGNTSTDYVYGLCNDVTGNVIVTGNMNANVFPITQGVYQTAFGGAVDVTVVKFGANGNRIWSTYYGGTGGDYGSAIANDGDELVVVGGTYSDPFPLSAAPFQGIYGGGSYDGFVLRLDATGNRIWCTYFGTTGHDYLANVKVDGNGDIISSGFSNTTGLGTAGVFQQNYAGGTSFDALLAKFTPGGTRTWCTYYGGTDYDASSGITFESGTNDIYISGLTASTNLPLLPGAFQPANAGGANYNALIAKFNSAGTTRIWDTYYGGASGTLARGITTDNLNNVIFTGYTSSGLPISAGSFQFAYGGGIKDAYLVKFNSTGTTRAWATYIGGNQTEYGGSSVVTDCDNNIYTFGETSSLNFPITTSCAYQTSYGGNTDHFFGKFSPAGARIFLSYLGGAMTEASGSGGLLSLSKGQLFMTGMTNGGPYPTTPGAYQTAYGGGSYDFILAAMCPDRCGTAPTINFSANLTNIPCGTAGITSFTPTITTCDTTGVLWQWTFTGGTPSSSTDRYPNNITYNATGSFDVKLKIVTPCFSDSLTKNNYITTNIGSLPTVTTSANDSICSGEQATLTASGVATYSWNPSMGLSSTTGSSVTASPGITTNYTVTGTDAGGCTNTSTVSVTVQTPTLTVSSNITIIKGTSTVITASGSGSYSWTPSSGLSCVDCPSPTASPTSTTKYYIVTTDSEGCTKIDSVTVIVEELCSDYFIPNAFSPNDDQENDVFNVYGNCFNSFFLVIYDRWGEQVFQSEDQQIGWNGYVKEKLANSGVFCYRFSGTTNKGEQIDKTGNVSLIR